MTESGRPWIVLLLVLMIAQLTYAMAASMAYIALAAIYAEGHSPLHAGWLITAMALSAAGAAAICGSLGDVFGRRKMLAIILAIAALGSAISASSDDLNITIIGRFLQGVVAAVLPLCYGILRQFSPDDKLRLGIGVLAGTFGLCAGAATMLGGFIVDLFHWRGIFVVNAGVAIVALLLLPLLPADRGRGRGDSRIDWIGGILFVPAIALILLGVTLLKSGGWDAGAIVAMILAGIVLMVVWFRHELRLPDPLINVRLLRNRQIAFADMAMFAAGMGTMMIPLVVLPLLQQPGWAGVGFGFSASLAGMLWFGFTVVAGAATSFSGVLANRFGVFATLLTISAAVAIGWALMAGASHSVVAVLLISALVLNTGTNLIFALLPLYVLEASPPERTSETTGLTHVIRSLGSGVGSLMVPFLLSAHLVADPGGSSARLPGPQSYMLAFLWMIATTALIFLCIFLTRGSRRAAVPAR